MKKYNWFTTKVEYIGHAITLHRPSITEAHTKGHKSSTKQPRTLTEVYSFLARVGSTGSFILIIPAKRHYWTVSNKRQPPTSPPLDGVQALALKTLIGVILSSPILSLPLSGLPYSVATDSSDHHLGSALLQTQLDRERKPLSFWSHTLLPAENELLRIKERIFRCRIGYPNTKLIPQLWTYSRLLDKALLPSLTGITKPSE